MKKIALILGLFFVGSCVKPVATGSDTPIKRKEIKRHGLTKLGTWRYAKLKITGEDKLYAIKIDEEDGKLIAYCEETVRPYYKDGYGPFEDTVLWQQCTNQWLLSAIKMIED